MLSQLDPTDKKWGTAFGGKPLVFDRQKRHPLMERNVKESTDTLRERQIRGNMVIGEYS